jgi:pimeloyl-ACP methyl ester carboxylesterase
MVTARAPEGATRAPEVPIPTPAGAAPAPEVPIPAPPAREQTRARYPDETGVIERDGIRVAWERYGTGSPVVFLLPTWSIIHSRHWKLQIPDLARRTTVVTFDARGNGRSDRPQDPDAYAPAETMADALAVMDASGTRDAVLVSLSAGAGPALLLAAEHAERVLGVVFVGPALPLGRLDPERDEMTEFLDPSEGDEGWAKYNAHYWRRAYPDFLEFFFEQCFPEPHSTKPIEDCVGWGLETDPETLIATQIGDRFGDRDRVAALAARVRCPVLVIHGTDDRIRPHEHGIELARLTGGHLRSLAASGHCPHVRDPITVNLLIRDFLRRVRATA